MVQGISIVAKECHWKCIQQSLCPVTGGLEEAFGINSHPKAPSGKAGIGKGQDLAGGRAQLSYLMVCMLALDQRLSWEGTTAGQTKWCWWQPSPATSFALDGELFQHLVVLSCSVITSHCIIAGILCSKIWESSTESVAFRRVTAPAGPHFGTLNRTDVVHDHVQGITELGSSSCGIIRLASSTSLFPEPLNFYNLSMRCLYFFRQ